MEKKESFCGSYKEVSKDDCIIIFRRLNPEETISVELIILKVYGNKHYSLLDY